ncbi:U32 family peptidase [Brevirhabdus pacifica]|uniref:Ubiquinone biosynthesis protein UbiV n=1 Tax=Brevirhabdus pacifica TaxID=1267768 RepID=A0A1U7DLV4_9RHOB|nr:U32 family peptidase [Brevirhabdus pacifica]APX90960.1 U32 family peptidase [Brevirhabdus pacifica]OWU80410.1 protease [Loktanella sp. 22II-4b]PJJ86366.1 collagenase-like PrtC family protease [Brevirhabdus pacifica]
MTQTRPARAALTLGPIAYHWSPRIRRDFYARIADEAPIDAVYVGEVVCSKRAPFVEDALPEVVERLRRGGKRVIHSSLAEVMLPRERKATAALVAEDALEVEINNAAGLLGADGRRHRIGPFMNVYNAETLDELVRRGAEHVCLPVEMRAPSIALMAARGQQIGVGIEVQVFGRAPLATSARCYHARAHGRTKDNCRFLCEKDRDGMPLTTRDGSPFLRVNGIQTLSETYVALGDEVAALQAMGVSHLRLMPELVDMVAVARLFDGLRCGTMAPDEATARLAELSARTPLSNGFYHGKPGHRHLVAQA